jgi:hypothetical protein
LGKVFENLLASYNEDTETTARKALGAFYTPRSVVSYMVDEALCCFLATKVPSTSADKLRQLIQATPGEYDPHQEFSQDEIHTLIQEIGKVRVLDHACGSGAYLMGALHRLVDLLQKLDPKNAAWKQDKLKAAQQLLDDRRKEGADEEEQQQHEERIREIQRSFDVAFHELDYARKLYLIEDCIYGVDIQPVACQIAKLRFFISLIVDQKVKRQSANLGVRPMPNLETKIVAANALLPIDFPQLDLFSMGKVEDLRKDLLRIRHEHFDARTPQRKKRLREKDKSLRAEIAKFLKESGLPSESANALAGWDPYNQSGFAPFFDPSWMFGFSQKDALFDVVLANPPYVRQEKIKDQKAALKPHYTQTYSGTADLYVYFYDRALQLLRPNGALSFITSNKWFRSAYGENLRKYLARDTTLHHVIDFGDAPVFTAIAYPTILVAQKGGASEGHKLSMLCWDPETPKEEIDRFASFYTASATTMAQSDLKADGWRFVDGKSRKVLERIRKAGIPLGDFVKGRMYRGILTGLNEAFVVPRETRDRLIAEDPKSKELLKPFLRGRDVKRWRIEYQDLWLILIESSENKTHPWSGKDAAQAEKIFAKTYPSIHRFFHEGDMRERLIKRYDQGKYFWELRSCSYYPEFEQPKVFIPAIAGRPEFSPDAEGFFSNNKSTICVTDHPFYVTALANSQVGTYFAMQTYATKAGGFRDFEPRYSSSLPIPEYRSPLTKQIEQLARLVSALTLQDNVPPRDTLMLGYFEQILNALVYELYFPEDLHKKGLKIFELVEKAKLPDIESLPEAQRLPTLREAFERLYDLKHPLRGALQSIRSLDVVRIIEGEHEG